MAEETTEMQNVNMNIIALSQTSEKLNNPGDNDEDESKEFCHREDILNPHGPLHIPSVDCH